MNYFRYHPHHLVGDNCDQHGVYSIDIYTDTNNPKVLTFPDLRIERCLKSDIEQRIKARQNPNEEIDDMQRDIHRVRLCFQVSIQPDPNNPNSKRNLEPKYSLPITSKTVATEMTIYKISDTWSPASGGKTIIIFCNKIDNTDIKIRFFEKDAQNRDTFIGDSRPRYVHRNVGISFETPRYDGILVGTQANVFVEMVRPSDQARSNPLSFQYVPDVSNIDEMTTKKLEKISAFKNTSISRIVQENTFSEELQQSSSLQQDNIQPDNVTQFSHFPQPYVTQEVFDQQEVFDELLQELIDQSDILQRIPLESLAP